ncbi:MAG TPA: hypothetical protein VF549_05570 [Solirubrobacteraceae bacterium]|jgi:uncharacterized membrane protein YkoI
MFRQTKKLAMAAAALAALALGGSAIAGAASNSSTTATNPPAAQGQRPDPATPGGHVGSNGRTEKALSGDVAAKVKAAAEKKLPGGTVLRVETDVDHGSPYEAHVQKADGSEVEVLVDESFQVTAVNTMGRP